MLLQFLVCLKERITHPMLENHTGSVPLADKYVKKKYYSIRIRCKCKEKYMAGKCFLITDGHTSWIVDVWATNHMTRNELLLLDESKVGNA